MSASVSTFKTDQPSLQELLDGIDKGSIQLPDFQRGWVWSDDAIRGLLASISLSFPIGAVMTLETGGDVRFKPRPIEGAEPPAGVEPEKLVLDGQQRLTSLYLAVRSPKPVPTKTEKGKKIERHYYIDIAKALDPAVDRVDAIESVPADRVVRTNFNRDIELDLSSREKEYAAGKLPTDTLFDFKAFSDWRNGFQKHHKYAQPVMEQWQKFEEQICQRFTQYKLPVIELKKATPKEAVCQVFEKVNTGGVSLTVFELVTATFAADDFQLRKDWATRRKALEAKELLEVVEPENFLTSLTLLARYEGFKAGGAAVSCKRKDVLDLTLAQYQAHADRIQRGLVDAARFLRRERVYESRNLPYATQLMPLAATLAHLGKRAEDDAVKRKLARWYWCGVFGELYGGSTETRFANDIQDVVAWIEGGDEPRTVRDASFAPTRLLTLQTRRSAAYKGIAALLLRAGSDDFWSGDPIELTTYFDLAIDIHHVFPQKWCKDQELPVRKWNSVINKAPLTARTNRSIGGRAPSEYLGTIDKKLTAKRVDELLATHLIDPALLRADDFDGFIRARASCLLDAIEAATGKPVQGRDSEETVEAFGGPLPRAEESKAE